MELATLNLLAAITRTMSFLVSSKIHTEELSITRKMRSHGVRASVWNTACVGGDSAIKGGTSTAVVHSQPDRMLCSSL